VRSTSSCCAGCGLAATKIYLAAEGSGETVQALQHIRRCEAAGDFAGFSVPDQTAWYTAYYR
jgi:hypothetical protein